MRLASGICKLEWSDDGKLLGFIPAEDERYTGFRPFKICVAGESEGQFSELTAANCLLSEQFVFAEKIDTDGGCTFVYRHERLRLRVEVEIVSVADTGIFRTCTRIVNEGEDPIVINHFSSAFVTGFGGGISETPPPYRVHYFESAWHAEARHIEKSVRELGLTYVSPHFMSKSFTLTSQGGYSTAKYFPALYVEDSRSNVIRFMVSECDGSWRMQLGHAAAYAAQNAGWYLESCAVSASDLGTDLVLAGKESYEAPPVLFGAAAGGMDEATAALTRARRVLYKKETAPLMFNDYMNCLWSDVTEEKICRLAEKAAELGTEGYCIDCGWYLPIDNMYGRLGDWEEGRGRFPVRGLRGTLAYIRSLGLILGVWTELEVCSDNAEAFSLPDEYFIRAYGSRVGGGERFFFDMQNSAVRAYLLKKVEKLYQMGVRYIKNDFNAALRWTTDANTIARNHRAAMSFYDEVKHRFPDLYLENCGSGAMRCDYGTLRHFCNQSVSDQELYYLNPPVVQGMLANILPEQAGIWAYPYPHLFDVRADEKALSAEAERQKDGRQTIFNMVNGIVGNLYLSGRLDYADEKNSALIREGIALFKALRSFKESAVAVYPNGFADISDPGEFTSLGFTDGGSRMVLFFWRFNGENKRFIVPLKKWAKGNVSVRRVYPAEEHGVTASVCGTDLAVTAQQPRSAAIFEVDLGK